MTPTPRLGLALGGGGSRAFVHLGVLSRLDEAGIRPACISGSSMGAVLGALYAMDPSGDAAINRILDSFRKSSHFGGLIRQDKGDGLHRRPGRLGSLARKLATASVAGVISFRKGLRRFHPVNAAIDDFFGKDNVSFDQLKIPFAANALTSRPAAAKTIIPGSSPRPSKPASPSASSSRRSPGTITSTPMPRRCVRFR